MTPRGENMITGYPLEMKKFIHKVTEAKKKKKVNEESNDALARDSCRLKGKYVDGTSSF